SLGTNTAGSPISVGGNPLDLIISPDGRLVYVSDAGQRDVTPIDTSTNVPLTPIDFGSADNFLTGLAITPDGATLYVADFNFLQVYVVSTATNTIRASIPVARPGRLAMAPDGATLYVTNPEVNTVTPVATASNVPSAPIPVGSYPVYLAITPD